MKPLTRRVLIEKQPEFWIYSQVFEVPDWLWEKSFNELSKKKNSDDVYEYIASKILCPMLNAYDYSIGEIKTRSGDDLDAFRIITIYNPFANLGFELSMSLAGELPDLSADWLKRTINIMRFNTKII